MQTRKMTEGNPFQTILLFAIPMICSNLFQQFYNVMDTLIVGNRLGKDALAAVGSAGSIIAVFVQLAMGLSLGGSIVMAQFFGAGKNEKIRSCASTLTLFSAGIGLVCTIVIWIFARKLLILVNMPEEILSVGTDYLRVYFLGSVPIFVYNALSSVYTSLGNSKAPLKFLVISSAVNIGLDLLFIVVFRLGVVGAAAATAIAQLLAMALAVWDMPKLLSQFPKEEGKGILFDTGLLIAMLRFALPAAVQQSVVSVGSVVVQATINTFGAAVIAGSTAASKIMNLATTIPINYGNAYANYVGQNMGAGKTERIWPGLRSSLLCCGAVSLLLTFVIEIFSEPILRMFVSETDADMMEVLAVGERYIQVVGSFLVVFSIYMLVKATFKGSGDMSWFIFTTLLSFLIRLAITVGLSGQFGVGVIWWGFANGWLVAMVVSIARYVQGGWKKKAIIKQKG